MRVNFFRFVNELERIYALIAYTEAFIKAKEIREEIDSCTERRWQSN